MIKMLYCNNCKKGVVVYGVSSNVDPKELDGLIDHMIKEGKLVLFNPPPIFPYYCPQCGTKLEENS